MRVPNQPKGRAQAERRSEWTPLGGLLRGAVLGVVVAVLLTAALVPVALGAPQLLLSGLPRLALGFVVTWVLAASVQRGAGMVGWPCTVMAVGLAVVVLLSSHVVFAIHGVPGPNGLVAGWQWMSPSALLASNLLTPIGIVAAAALCHQGSGILDTVIDLVMRNTLTGGR